MFNKLVARYIRKLNADLQAQFDRTQSQIDHVRYLHPGNSLIQLNMDRRQTELDEERASLPMYVRTTKFA